MWCSDEQSPMIICVFEAISLAANLPFWMEGKRDGFMKSPSVIARNWWSFIFDIAATSSCEGFERSNSIFSEEGREWGMERTERSSLNWSCVSSSDFGGTPGPFECMITLLIQRFLGA